MSGWKAWSIGEVVEATDFQNYVQDQVVQVYAGTAARTTALGTAVTEGMVSYLSDTNTLQFYNGTSWENVSSPKPVGSMPLSMKTVSISGISLIRIKRYLL